MQLLLQAGGPLGVTARGNTQCVSHGGCCRRGVWQCVHGFLACCTRRAAQLHCHFAASVPDNITNFTAAKAGS